MRPSVQSYARISWPEVSAAGVWWVRGLESRNLQTRMLQKSAWDRLSQSRRLIHILRMPT